MTSQQPGWPQQPNNQQVPNTQPPNAPSSNAQAPQPEGTPYPPIPPAPAFGPDGQPPQFPPYAQQQGQPDYTQQYGPAGYGNPGEQFGNPGQQYGNPGDPYGQGTTFMQAPPKKGMPVWGWVAGGAGIVAVIVVAGVIVFNGLASNRQPDAVPVPNVSGSAAPEESAGSDDLPSPGASELYPAVYLFEDPGFSSAPVWSVRDPQGWTKEEAKDGMVNYRNADLQCTFTTYQAVIDPTGETDDEVNSARIMASEIEGVKSSLGGRPVEVVDDTRSIYVPLRDKGQEIEMQQAELRFKNDSDADVVYRLAVRATSGGEGLMELAMACPAGMTNDYQLWQDLAARVSMVDAP